jgi:hypothetical protein
VRSKYCDGTELEVEARAALEALGHGLVEVDGDLEAAPSGVTTRRESKPNAS